MSKSKAFRDHAQRRRIRSLCRKLKSDTIVLRVVGTQAQGFRLGGEFKGFQPGHDAVLTFGKTWSKQADAINHGVRQFGQTARKKLKAA